MSVCHVSHIDYLTYFCRRKFIFYGEVTPDTIGDRFCEIKKSKVIGNENADIVSFSVHIFVKSASIYQANTIMIVGPCCTSSIPSRSQCLVGIQQHDFELDACLDWSGNQCSFISDSMTTCDRVEQIARTISSTLAVILVFYWLL